MVKRLLLAVLSVLLVAAPASAAYFDMQAGAFSASFRYVATSTLTTSDYLVAPARGFNRIAFTKGSAFAATVYACETNTYVAASCTSVTTLSATDTDIEVTTGRPWFVIDVTTAETGSNVSYITIKSNPQEASGGGGGGATSDADGDGLYEARILWDADGDGSTEVTCTAKDTPDSACKADGEIIYGDFADDLNCAIWGCGFGQMENNGSLYLKAGVVYVNFPCWEPTNVTNTRGGITDDNEHDAVADAAWSICPATPDPDTTRRFYTISLMDWQGEIIGGGVDTRNPATTTGYKRDQGTYLVDDRGPAWYSGTNSGNNTWFGQAGFIRGITFGFENGGIASTTAGASTGEYMGDGDSKGYGSISGTQTLATVEANGYLCVANTSGLDTLVAGDIVQITGTSGLSSTSATEVFAIRMRDVPDATTCNGAGTIRLRMGGRVGYVGTDVAWYAANAPYITSFQSGAPVVAARSDYLDSTARISNLTIEPQDWWDEGGDCQEVSTTSSGPWTPSLDGDGTNADIDCDTNPLFGMYGGGAPTLENVVIKHWHEFAIDGNSNAGFPLLRRIRFFDGKGGPIVDAGSGWRMEDFEVRETQFANGGVSTFGPGLEMRNFRVINSTGYQFMNFTDISVGDLVENLKIEGGAFNTALGLGCGARRNTFRNISVDNTIGIGSTSTSTTGIIAALSCATTSTPIEMNVFDGFTATGVKFATVLDGNVTTAISFDTDATIATPGSAAISRNSFINGRMKSTRSAYDACLFAAVDDDTSAAPNDRTTPATDDYSHEDVLALNTFFNNSVHASGGGGAADYVYCGCSINIAGAANSTPGSGADSSATCSATVGSGSGIGANAIGCGNLDNNAVPAAGQTCS